jgi:hypothetical protein
LIGHLEDAAPFSQRVVDQDRVAAPVLCRLWDGILLGWLSLPSQPIKQFRADASH